MKKTVTIFLLAFCGIISSQTPNKKVNPQKIDSLVTLIEAEHSIDTIHPIILNKVKSNKIAKKKKIFKYSDNDLKMIDSLLVKSKFSSPLFDENDYLINESMLVSDLNIDTSPEVLKLRLAQINATTEFNIEYNPALEKIIKNYVKYRRRYYPALMARAKYFFPIFEQYLDQYDIPLEMKYLAIVESALDPKAKSRVGATGLWQFMFGTGKQFKLAVNTYVDERQDPIKSTIAACKYLNQLYDRFNDWDLALAAYNSGPGNVLKAIKRSGGYKNYWNIRPYLPVETAGYVPAFYATMYVFKYAKELNIHSEKTAFHTFETDTIRVKRTITFDQITQKTGISQEVLQLLNPQYKIDVIPYIEKKLFSVRLPRNKIIDFLNIENDIYSLADTEDASREKPLPKYFEMDQRVRYKIRNGDYLGKIANKFGVKVSQIKRWNNMRSTRLKVGKRLIIYPRKM